MDPRRRKPLPWRAYAAAGVALAAVAALFLFGSCASVPEAMDSADNALDGFYVEATYVPMGRYSSASWGAATIDQDSTVAFTLGYNFTTADDRLEAELRRIAVLGERQASALERANPAEAEPGSEEDFEARVDAAIKKREAEVDAAIERWVALGKKLLYAVTAVVLAGAVVVWRVLKSKQGSPDSDP